MDGDLLNKRIGERIKDLRHINGLTQQELADRTELTKGFISQLENGQVSPSVLTLMDLIECLGVTPSEFCEETNEKQIVFKEEEYFEKIDDQGNSIQWVVPSAQGNQMEPLLVELQPHTSLEEDLPHQGEEFGYVLAGQLELKLGKKKFTVKKGESFYYPADKNHTVSNISGRVAKFIWVCTPPMF